MSEETNHSSEERDSARRALTADLWTAGFSAPEGQADDLDQQTAAGKPLHGVYYNLKAVVQTLFILNNW